MSDYQWSLLLNLTSFCLILPQVSKLASNRVHMQLNRSSKVKITWNDTPLNTWHCLNDIKTKVEPIDFIGFQMGLRIMWNWYYFKVEKNAYTFFMITVFLLLCGFCLLCIFKQVNYQLCIYYFYTQFLYFIALWFDL